MSSGVEVQKIDLLLGTSNGAVWRDEGGLCIPQRELERKDLLRYTHPDPLSAKLAVNGLPQSQRPKIEVESQV